MSPNPTKISIAVKFYVCMLYGCLCVSCSQGHQSEKPEANIKCLSLSCPTLVSETGSLFESRAPQFHLD